MTNQVRANVTYVDLFLEMYVYYTCRLQCVNYFLYHFILFYYKNIKLFMQTIISLGESIFKVTTVVYF
jgi:hypothetical protein